MQKIRNKKNIWKKSKNSNEKEKKKIRKSTQKNKEENLATQKSTKKNKIWNPKVTSIGGKLSKKKKRCITKKKLVQTFFTYIQMITNNM